MIDDSIMIIYYMLIARDLLMDMFLTKQPFFSNSRCLHECLHIYLYSNFQTIYSV